MVDRVCCRTGCAGSLPLRGEIEQLFSNCFQQCTEPFLSSPWDPSWYISPSCERLWEDGQDVISERCGVITAWLSSCLHQAGCWVENCPKDAGLWVGRADWRAEFQISRSVFLMQNNLGSNMSKIDLTGGLKQFLECLFFTDTWGQMCPWPPGTVKLNLLLQVAAVVKLLDPPYNICFLNYITF